MEQLLVKIKQLYLFYHPSSSMDILKKMHSLSTCSHFLKEQSYRTIRVPIVNTLLVYLEFQRIRVKSSFFTTFIINAFGNYERPGLLSVSDSCVIAL